MEEEKQEEEEGEDSPSENLSIVDQAKNLHSLIKAENDRREKILKEEQKLQAEQLLAGTGGGQVKPDIKEMTPAEYTRYIEEHGVAPKNETN